MPASVPDGTSVPEPTVIIPTGHCWEWHANRPHEPHLFGDVPNVYRCPGVDTKTPQP